MTLLEFLNNITQNNIVKIKDAASVTVNNFYTDTIQINLPTDEVILAWDKILNQYINEPDAVFFIRKYGSAPNKQWHLLRRGFLTEFSNCRFIYCDNFLAHYFFNMAIEGYVPDYTDFKNTMLNFQFPYGFMETKEEIAYRASPIGKSPKINPNGWKLAHIYSVNQNDYLFNYKDAEAGLFDVGEHTDWLKYEATTSRKYNRYLTPDDIQTVKAHFLRFVHPINYFLVPKRKHHKSDDGSNIGENVHLLQFMKTIQFARFGNLYLDYKKNIAALDNYAHDIDPSEKIINIEIFKAATASVKKTGKVKKDKSAPTLATYPDLLKIGKLVRQSLKNLIDNNLLHDMEVELLTNAEYCKTTFNLNFPLLIKITPADGIENLKTVNGHIRYWTNTLAIKGSDYLMCKEWYENNRTLFLEWLNKRKRTYFITEEPAKQAVAYRLIRDVSAEECNWLDRTYKTGDMVYKHSEYAYKLIGNAGLAFTEQSGTLPFFELPADAVKLA